MQPEKLPLITPDLATERLEQLRELLPEAFKEGQLDLEQLRVLIGEAGIAARERYGLTWVGKSDAIRLGQKPTTATLRPDSEQSVGFDTTGHVIIEGDNLEVLKLLQKSYHGAVKMIYIDPPYNTGNDFVYPDDFKDPLRAYLEMTGQVEDGVKRTTRIEANGRLHSRWLSMIYPRLQLAKSLLRDDGVIFVSIDDKETHNLRVVMDEIFGEEHFIGNFVRRRRMASGMRGEPVSPDHEYVACYAKNKDAVSLVGLSKDESLYPLEDDQSKFASTDLSVGMTKNQRPGQYYEVENPATGKKWFPLETRVWRFKPETMQREIDRKNILFPDDEAGKGLVRPRYKTRFDPDADKRKPYSTWIDMKSAESEDDAAIEVLLAGMNQEGTKELADLFGFQVFDYPKPTSLLKALLAVSNCQNCVVLDFFGGSGSMGDAVISLNQEDGGNRKYVLVQYPESRDENSEGYSNGLATIAAVTRERMRLAAQRVAKESNGSLNLKGEQDLGFRAFTLSDSNFLQWDPENPDLEGQLEALVSNVKDARSNDDILWEILLKSGVPLSERVQTQEVNGQTVHVAQDGKLIVVLARPILEDTMRGVMALKPDQVICLDVAFEGNDALKTNIVLEMRDQQIVFRTV